MSCENSCFICLQQVLEINEEQFNSLNIFFNYLKISEIQEAFVCEICGEKLAKFGDLCKALAKVRLEMDALLGFVQASILGTSGDFKGAPVGSESVREAVVKRCKEKLQNPKPEIIQQKVDAFKLIQTEEVYCDDDPLGNWIDEGSDEGSSASTDEEDLEAFPVTKMKKTETEVNLKDDTPTGNPKCSKKNKGVQCPICFKTIATNHKLKVHHEAVHLRLKPYKCSTCLKDFARFIELRGHVDAVHLRFRPFKCNQCDMAFGRADKLQAHKFTHDKPSKPVPPKDPNSKIFPCDKCDKSFDTRKKFNNHQVQHREKNFSCDICKKIAFKTNAELRRHVTFVHEKRRLPCLVAGCDKRYSERYQLVNHCKMEHPDFLKTPSQLDNSRSTIDDEVNVVKCTVCRKRFKSEDEVKAHLYRVHGLVK